MIITKEKNGREYNYNIRLSHNADEDFYLLRCFDEYSELLGQASFKVAHFDRRPSIWILSIETLQKFQNRGIGSLMLEIVENVAKSRRIAVIEGKFYPKNEYARGFYEKNGYMITQEDTGKEIYKCLSDLSVDARYTFKQEDMDEEDVQL